VLGDHRADNVTDGDHPHHPCAVDHRDVSDTLLCKMRLVWQIVSIPVPSTITVIPLVCFAEEHMLVTCHQLHRLQDLGVGLHGDQFVLSARCFIS
jgi:hypothetical protein